MSPKWIKRIIVTLIAGIFAFSLFHASWLAPDPQGRPKLIASTPLDLPRDTQGCVLTAAIGYGATAVSAETKDASNGGWQWCRRHRDRQRDCGWQARAAAFLC